MGFIANIRYYAATMTAATRLRELRESGEEFIPAFVIADIAEQYHMPAPLLARLLNERKQYKKESSYGRG